MHNLKFIEVDAECRYWEDTCLNGEPDNDGKIPFRQGNLWKPVIELATGKILNWPLGVSADVHYKVCDAGEYWLLDEDKNRIFKWKDYYVPNRILCIDDNGYGDYIIFKIKEDGSIINWKNLNFDEDEWIKV